VRAARRAFVVCGVAQWTIKGGPVEGGIERRAGRTWAWQIERGDEVRVVSVFITKDARRDAEIASRGVSRAVREAARSRGRRAVERYLDEDEPPGWLIVKSDGIQLDDPE
jgi:hypothetical protein